MSAGDQSGSFFEFFNRLLSNLLDRKVSSAQFVISLFTAFSRCFMKMSSTDLNRFLWDSTGNFPHCEKWPFTFILCFLFFNQLLILSSPFISIPDDFVSLSVCIDLLKTI